ncbi:hypothetical protein K438DRAFT_1771191 [Mycena galopus ATCC 62051]|nr:hypothetical protein K438DRAFT_1771191 [Mycena galopus ATCC 62051]
MNEILDLFVGLYARNLWAVLSPDLETGKLASRDSLTQITASHHDKLQPACLVQMSLQAKLSSGKWKVFIWLIRNSSSAAYWHKMAEGFPNRNLFGVLGNIRQIRAKEVDTYFRNLPLSTGLGRTNAHEIGSEKNLSSCYVPPSSPVTGPTRFRHAKCLSTLAVPTVPPGDTLNVLLTRSLPTSKFTAAAGPDVDYLDSNGPEDVPGRNVCDLGREALVLNLDSNVPISTILPRLRPTNSYKGGESGGDRNTFSYPGKPTVSSHRTRLTSSTMLPALLLRAAARSIPQKWRAEVEDACSFITQDSIVLKI